MGFEGTWGGRGWARSIARPWVPFSSPLTHCVYLLPCFSDLAGSKMFLPVRPVYDHKYHSTSYRIDFLLIYKVYIRPHLEFCIQAWSSHLVKDVKLLERIQNLQQVWCLDFRQENPTNCGTKAANVLGIFFSRQTLMRIH